MEESARHGSIAAYVSRVHAVFSSVVAGSVQTVGIRILPAAGV